MTQLKRSDSERRGKTAEAMAVEALMRWAEMVGALTGEPATITIEDDRIVVVVPQAILSLMAKDSK